MAYEHIERREEGDWAVITMSRPERRNALSEGHLRELHQVLGEIGGGSQRGVILAAQGPVFSAGHDFSDLDGRDLVAMRDLLALCADVMQLVQGLPQVVIAQVDGLATAAGCQLVSSCDLAVASETSRFQVPGGAGGWFCTTPGVALARAVGRKHALEMLLTGDPIDASEAGSEDDAATVDGGGSPALPKPPATSLRLPPLLLLPLLLLLAAVIGCA